MLPRVNEPIRSRKLTIGDLGRHDRPMTRQRISRVAGKYFWVLRAACSSLQARGDELPLHGKHPLGALRNRGSAQAVSPDLTLL
jgi:hypothetical protein